TRWPRDWSSDVCSSDLGSTLVEKWIDCLVSQASDRAVVIAAANMFGKRLHAAGKVTAAQPVELKWEIFANDTTNNEMEIWYSGEIGRASCRERVERSGR